MNSPAYQLHRVKQAIRVHGQEFLFSIKEPNEFDEPTGKIITIPVRGLYHETTGYLSESSSDSTTIRKRSSPGILVCWESLGPLKIQAELEFNNKTYRVTEIKNLGESNIIGDISLLEIQNGN